MLNFILVSFCTAYIILIFLLLGLGSVLGLELGLIVMVEVIWLNFISGPVT